MIWTRVGRRATCIERESIATAEHAKVVVERMIFHHDNNNVFDLRQEIGAFRFRTIPPLAGSPQPVRFRGSGRGRLRSRHGTW